MTAGAGAPPQPEQLPAGVQDALGLDWRTTKSFVGLFNPRGLLDAGEAQVLVHAMAGTAPLCVLDDRAARRVARALDLKVIGTIGLVAWAKSTGLVRLAAPVLDELCRAGMRVSTPLIDEVLDLVGEPR